ncbi:MULTISPECIES: hypothetical protein [Phenylobacterium]|uniref:Twin-arginine translocation pathway signal n=1 Tax=Phenylobacterium koreense TaxID=266125 RepID=A0ABV2EH89_9CAUL
MRAAVLPIAAAAVLSACATPNAKVAASAAPQADFSAWSCRELATELSLTERAYFTAARRERQSREGASAQAFYSPASYYPAPPKSSAKLRARLDDLRKASRAKRCTSQQLIEATTA